MWSGLIAAGMSRDPPPVVDLCKRRVCLDITSYSSCIQNSGGSVRTRGTAKRDRSTLSAPGFKLCLECSDYRTIYCQSKDFLIRKRSESDYSFDSGYLQLMDFTTEKRPHLEWREQSERYSNTAKTSPPKAAAKSHSAAWRPFPQFAKIHTPDGDFRASRKLSYARYAMTTTASPLADIGMEIP